MRQGVVALELTVRPHEDNTNSDLLMTELGPEYLFKPSLNQMAGERSQLTQTC